MTTVGITKFAMKHTDEKFVGTRLTENQLHEIRFLTESKINLNIDVKDGYAVFCKEISIIDFPINCPIAKITPDNYPHLRSNYVLRNAGELPHLARFFAKGTVDPMPAHHITVIVYSKEQLMAEGDDYTGCDYDIVTVLAQPCEGTAPMNPYTMIRNHMGKEFGGSGVKVNREEYEKAVEFWSEHAMIE